MRMIEPNQEPSELLLMFRDCYPRNDCALITANFLAAGEPSSVNGVSVSRSDEVCGCEALFVEACGWPVRSRSVYASVSL